MKIKHISAGCFIVAFLMAIVLFGGVGSTYIQPSTAKGVFIISGVIGMFLNLIAYKTEQNKKEYNFLYWLGTIVLFTGLMFKIMQWRNSLFIIIGGVIIMGVSFFYTPKIESEEENEDLLDNPKNGSNE